MSNQSPIVPILVNLLGAGIPALMDHFSPQKVAERKLARLKAKGIVSLSLTEQAKTPPPVANTVATVIGAAQVAAGGTMASGLIDLTALAPEAVQLAPEWFQIAYYALMASGLMLATLARITLKKP